MITTTVKDTLKEDIGDMAGHFIYLYRDGETILYIGRSINPCERLREHMGMGRSPMSRLGNFIRRHHPQSREWTGEFYTLAECLPFINKEQRPSYQTLLDGEQAFIEHQQANQTEWERKAAAAFPWFEIDYRSTFLAILYKKLAHIEAMIAYYRPCLNVLNNPHATPLPHKYREGVIVVGEEE